MEKDNVPQDDENVFEGHFKVVYALDKDGNYTRVPTKGWEPENIALSQAWQVINEKVEDAKKLIEAGKASPLLYHMEKNMLELSVLADYMELSSRKVRKHLEPAEFSKLDRKTLEHYAKVFQITPEQLLKTE